MEDKYKHEITNRTFTYNQLIALLGNMQKDGVLHDLLFEGNIVDNIPIWQQKHTPIEDYFFGFLCDHVVVNACTFHGRS